MYIGHSFIFLIIYEGDPWEETWAWHTSFWSGCFKTCFIKVTNYIFGSASIHGICCTHCTQCLWSKKIMRTVQQHCSTRKILLVIWRKIAQHDEQFAKLLWKLWWSFEKSSLNQWQWALHLYDILVFHLKNVEFVGEISALSFRSFLYLSSLSLFVLSFHGHNQKITNKRSYIISWLWAHEHP